MTEELTIETIHENEPELRSNNAVANPTNEAHENETPAINIKDIPLKRICELTEQEKKALYDASKRNEYSDYYDIKPFANGNYRIIKKKPTSFRAKAIASNGEVDVETPKGNQKVYMSNDQLVWMHLMDLESKYNKLYAKHKKLKRKYNDLYIEDADIGDTGYNQNNETFEEPIRETPRNEVPRNEAPTTQAEYTFNEQPVSTSFGLPRGGAGWRAMLMQKGRA